jgi:hypothetical protein
MIKLILQQYVHTSSSYVIAESMGKIVCEVGKIVPPGVRNYVYSIPPFPQVFHDHAVIEIPAGYGIEGTVNH